MGARPPRRVEQTVREQWHRGVFDAQRGDDAAETLREWLMDDNYLQRRSSTTIDDVAERTAACRVPDPAWRALAANRAGLRGRVRDPP